MRHARQALSVLLALLSITSASLVSAQDVGGSAYVQGNGGWYRRDDRSGPYAIGSDGVARSVAGLPTGSSSFSTAQVTVGTAPTLLAAARPGRGAVTLENLGSTAVYIGGSGVSSSTGLLLPATAGASLTVPTSAAIYGVVATGTQGVAVLETY